ncbi:MAG: hypothetical protein JW999_06770 [Methanotrichaceae archaeon]|nr:hypothetical protein [Methanotrichaceae archaeon]
MTGQGSRAGPGQEKVAAAPTTPSAARPVRRPGSGARHRDPGSPVGR